MSYMSFRIYKEVYKVVFPEIKKRIDENINA